ncbi:MAG: ribonuclease HII [Betaproteobacteria bacterium RIFCSPLOWO2_02_FULL_62_17]|nr:MAG: ribonuclease HII [Betaproteobacteria bacterium RIFCSPLOWO2_02_FULL_62_17]
MVAERLICGVDEAGRGPLAGPVFAAAVVFRGEQAIAGVADSKVLAPRRREILAATIRAQALAWAVAQASVEEIDRLNILQASLLAMRRAVLALGLAPSLVLVDGRQRPALDYPTRAVVRGDASVPQISAASILAKTARDLEMLRLHALYPQYGLDRHKGYPTPQHLSAIKHYGVCEIHRQSYAPVRKALQERAGARP